MKANYRRCRGIDVHKDSVTVCVLPAVGQPGTEIKRRKFPTFTRDLKQMRAWLKTCQVTDIAMESTGQYWGAVWNLWKASSHVERRQLSRSSRPGSAETQISMKICRELRFPFHGIRSTS
jgi:transposase